jgi:hypothetical protein
MVSQESPAFTLWNLLRAFQHGPFLLLRIFKDKEERAGGTELT